MLNRDTRQTIHLLHKAKKSNREIGRLLNISKSAVGVIVKQGVDIPSKPKKSLKNKAEDITPILRDLFTRCLGNVVRIQEVLKEEYDIDMTYSTLKRCVRNADLRAPRKRVGEYRFKPGEEMQHDTSPHWVMVGGKRIKAQCASLILGYSRKLYVQYYLRFTRFEAKIFLKAAIEFMSGSCRRCIVDNTSVILCAGAGADAVVSPEMATFSRMYGFEYAAHRIGHADRKGKIERPFYYAETNFLAGRVFQDWEDLNAQAKEWCLRANGKEKRALGMSADAAFIQEKPHLVPLPEVEPSIYEHHQRLVDCQGYVNLETNKYSVPEKLIGKKVDVYKYPETVSVLHNHKEIAMHPRLRGKHGFNRIRSHHSRGQKIHARQTTNKIEAALRGQNELLDQYVDAFKKHVRGSGHRPFNRLLNLKRTYPADAFCAALKQAHKYGLYDLNRFEEMIISSVTGDYFNLGEDTP